MNKSVKHAQLHQTIFVPGCGNLTATLSPTKMTGLKMLYTPDGLVVDYNSVTFVVPLANVACAVLAEPYSVEKASIPKIVKSA